jgi:hypothetical protein
LRQDLPKSGRNRLIITQQNFAKAARRHLLPTQQRPKICHSPHKSRYFSSHTMIVDDAMYYADENEIYLTTSFSTFKKIMAIQLIFLIGARN